MNVLLVDVGNSRWKLGLAHAEGPRLLAQGGTNDLERLERKARQSIEGIGRVLLASVAESALTEDIRRRLSGTATEMRLVASTDSFPELTLGYADPSQLGVDRALAMFAVRSQWSGPFCVIDAGTAVTIDFVNARGQHLGGFILPGQALARDCLLRGTAIPGDESTDPSALLGRDTAGAISLGGRYAVAGVVRQALSLTELQGFVEKGCTFVGGGDAASIETLLPPPVRAIDQPVLQGLNELARCWGA